MKGLKKLRYKEKNFVSGMKKFYKSNYLNFKVLRESVIIISDIKKKLKRLKIYKENDNCFFYEIEENEINYNK